LQAQKYLAVLIPLLRAQTLPPDEIIIVDSSSTDDTVSVARKLGCQVEVISRASFNHGGTRNLGTTFATGQILVFMTQDVAPADTLFIEELTRPIRETQAVAAYSRQIAYPDAPPPEVFARDFNYPADSFLKGAEDIPRLGIKAYFFSDAASAVRRDVFDAVGRYPEQVIVNEDMWLCAKLLQAGHKVAYASRSNALHSHHYTLRQQFKRYFDTGVFMRQSQEILKGARAGGEGLRFLRQLVSYLVKQRRWSWIPYAIAESGVKFLAYHLGKREHLLPRGIKRALSGYPAYWK